MTQLNKIQYSSNVLFSYFPLIGFTKSKSIHESFLYQFVEKNSIKVMLNVDTKGQS